MVAPAGDQPQHLRLARRQAGGAAAALAGGGQRLAGAGRSGGGRTPRCRATSIAAPTAANRSDASCPSRASSRRRDRPGRDVVGARPLRGPSRRGGCERRPDGRAARTAPAGWPSEMTSCATAPERAKAPIEVPKRRKRRLQLTVRGVQQSGVAGQEALEEPDVVLGEVGHGLVPGLQRRVGVRLGVRQPDDPQRVGEPVGVAELAGGAERGVRELQRLVDASGRLQAVDVRGNPVRPPRTGQRRDLAGQLDVAVQVAAVDLPERLDERRVAGLAGLVAGLALELGRPVGVRGRRLGPPDEAGVTRRGVQPGQPPDLGPLRGREQRPPPSRWSRTARPRTPSGPRGRRGPWPSRPDRDPGSTGTPTAGWPAPSAPSRPGSATRGRSSAPTAGRPRRRSTPHDGRGSRSRSPASASRSSANARMVSKRLYRVRRGVDGGRRRETCAPTSPAAAAPRSRRSASATAHRAGRSKPPANTDAARRVARSSSSSRS